MNHFEYDYLNMTLNMSIFFECQDIFRYDFLPILHMQMLKLAPETRIDSTLQCKQRCIQW